MPRKLVWIENENLAGFGCSECNWMFKAPGPLVGESLDELKQKYEAQRDKRVCRPRLCQAPKSQECKD